VHCSNAWKKQRYAFNESERRRQRLRHALWKYGKSLEELEHLLSEQGGRCAICFRHWKDCPAARPSRYEDHFLQHLYVDHDHATGKVRGLLCHGCNGAIGLFKDDPDRADAAAAYLETHP